MPKPSHREKLLTAGLQVVFEQGYCGASVRDIVRAAGVPQGSFTNHFRSKEAFCLEVLERYVDLVRQNIEKTLRNDATAPLERMRAWVDLQIRYLEQAGMRSGCLIGNYGTEASDHSEEGRPGVLADVTVEARLHEQRVITHLNGRGLRHSFVPGRVAVEDEGGQVVSERAKPRSAFRGHTAQTPWDDLHVAYFNGYALWTYLTIPFLYTYPGFVTEELPPWSENGEVWRPLKATFPADVASHAREQVSYFGPDGLLRRHEYAVEVLGGGTGLNYAADYRTVGGIVVPVTRRVYAADAEHRKIADPLLVSIDVHDISFDGD